MFHGVRRFSYTSVGSISVRLIRLAEIKKMLAIKQRHSQIKINKAVLSYYIAYYQCLYFRYQSSRPCCLERRLKKSRILGIFEALSWKHIMIARGNFYIKNYTNISPFKRRKQIIQSLSTTRDIPREMKHSP